MGHTQDALEMRTFSTGETGEDSKCDILFNWPAPLNHETIWQRSKDELVDRSILTDGNIIMAFSISPLRWDDEKETLLPRDAM